MDQWTVKYVDLMTREKLNPEVKKEVGTATDNPKET